MSTEFEILLWWYAIGTVIVFVSGLARAEISTKASSFYVVAATIAQLYLLREGAGGSIDGFKHNFVWWSWIFFGSMSLFALLFGTNKVNRASLSGFFVAVPISAFYLWMIFTG